MQCIDESLAVNLAQGTLLLLITCTVPLSIYGIHRLYINRNRTFITKITKRSQWVIHEIFGPNLAATLGIICTISVIPALCFGQHSDLIVHTETMLCSVLVHNYLIAQYQIFPVFVTQQKASFCDSNRMAKSDQL